MNTAPEQVPVTKLVEYYDALRQQYSRERMLAEARKLLERPQTLPECFERSVTHFSAFTPDPDIRFFSATAKGDKEKIAKDRNEKKFVATSKTRVFSAALKGIWGGRITVDGNRELNATYVDREVVPALMPEARFGVNTAGKPKSTRFAPQLDLLLTSEDQIPIAGEVKVGDDKDTVFALVQALTLASQLVTEPQLKRLRHQYPKAFDQDATRIDVWVILVGERKQEDSETLKDLAIELVRKLMEYEELTTYVRRIAIVDLTLLGTSVVAVSAD